MSTDILHSRQSELPMEGHDDLYKRIEAQERETAELQTRVRELEDGQRNDAALKELILSVIVEDIRTKGSDGLLSEIIQYVRER
jgi:hypothetical protein